MCIRDSVGTVESLWQANMDLLDDKELDLYNIKKDWKIYTEDTLGKPQIIGAVSYTHLKPDIEFLKDKPICKMLYQSNDLNFLMSLEKELSSIVAGCVTVSYSSNQYMEFNALGIDKGKGLIDLANKLGIDIKDTIAIGDNYNDISMLKASGLAVGANNAAEDVKNICDYVTMADNNEGVVAEVIERYIFNEI